MRAPFCSPYAFFAHILHHEDELELILDSLLLEDVFPLALQCRDLHAWCKRHYIRRSGCAQGSPPRVPGPPFRWYTSAATTESRLDWARTQFSYPHFFVPNAAALKTLAFQGDSVRYKELTSEFPALLATRDVHRLAGASRDFAVSHHLVCNVLVNEFMPTDLAMQRLSHLLQGAAVLDQTCRMERYWPTWRKDAAQDINVACIVSGSPKVLSFMLSKQCFLKSPGGSDPDRQSLMDLLELCVVHAREDLLRVLQEHFLDYIRSHLADWVHHTLPSRVLSQPLRSLQAQWRRAWGSKLAYRVGDGVATMAYMMSSMSVDPASFATDLAIQRFVDYGSPEVIQYVHSTLAPIDGWSLWAWGHLLTSKALDGSLHMADHAYRLCPHIPHRDRVLTEVVTQLLDRAANATDAPPAGTTCLEWQRVCEARCKAAVGWLHARGIPVLREHVQIAVSFGSPLVVAAMTARQAPLDRTSVLEHACRILDLTRMMYAADRVTRFQDMVIYLRGVYDAQWTEDCLRMVLDFAGTTGIRNWEFLLDVLDRMLASGYEQSKAEALHPGLRRRLTLRRGSL